MLSDMDLPPAWVQEMPYFLASMEDIAAGMMMMIVVGLIGRG
jgi:hypothetical protein